MSQENVEILRRLNAAWNARDVDAVRDLHHPDVVLRPIEGWPEAGPFVGREAVLRWFGQLREGWDTDAMEEISSTDAGDRVLVRLVWRGVRDGVESSMEFTAVYMLRQGRVFYQEIFWDHAEALEAVGLSE